MYAISAVLDATKCLNRFENKNYFKKTHVRVSGADHVEEL